MHIYMHGLIVQYSSASGGGHLYQSIIMSTSDERSCYSICTPARLFVFRIIYSCVGIFIGVSVAVVFPLQFDNVNVCGWGLAMALLSVLTLILFIYLFVVKEKKRRAPNPWVLFVFGVIGSVGVGVGVGGFATFLGLGLLDTLNHRELSLPKSHYVVCVWCFMTFKWGLTLFLYAVISFKYLDKVLKYKPMANEEFKDDPECVVPDVRPDDTQSEPATSLTITGEDKQGKT